jgi:excisionase family DNA binding protein
VAGGPALLLGVRQVAQQLGVCTATVYRLCEGDELPHVRILNAIRVTPADLAAYLARNRSGGPLVPHSLGKKD